MRPFRRIRTRRALRGAEARIVIGSGGTGQSGWIATDRDTLDLLNRDDWRILRYPIRAAVAEHVWEHLTVEDGQYAAETCHMYLAPGGWLRVAVPDGNHPNPEYIDSVRPGGTGCGSDDHRVLYDVDSLSSILESVGFSVTPLEYWRGGRFHATDWDAEDGMIHRSIRFDPRNRDGQPNYTSLIVDAVRSG